MIGIGKSSRLFIFGLVIQDHIESIGKQILLKGDEVLLMRLLLKMLSDIAPKTIIHFPKTHLSKTLIHHFGPTDSIFSEPPR
jgi:hypothetical protein